MSVFAKILIPGVWRPDKLNNQLTPLRGKPQIQFTQNWPRLDGATAAYPIYASAFYALSVIPEDFHVREYLDNSRTPEAYNKIIKGDADIIFVAQPSGGQKKRAEESGRHFDIRPLCREAFVFIVNADNPVNSLTEQQVRDIFSGAITNWLTVGGNDQQIQMATPGRLRQSDGDAITGDERCPHDLAAGNKWQA